MIRATATPSPLIAVTAGLTLSAMSTLLLALLYPPVYFLSPESFPKAPPYGELIMRFLLSSMLFLPALLLVGFLLPLKRQWLLRDDGILVRGRKSEEFIPWSGIREVAVSPFGLSLLRMKPRRRVYLSFVRGRQYWDLIPPEKRRFLKDKLM